MNILISQKRTRELLLRCFLTLVFFQLGLIIGAVLVYVNERRVNELLQKALATCSIEALHIQNEAIHDSNDHNWNSNLSLMTPSLKDLKIAMVEKLETQTPGLYQVRIKINQDISNNSTQNIATRVSKIKIQRSTIKPLDWHIVRCKEVRRRVSQGVVDYIRVYGDAELHGLIKPLFRKKKLVVWSLDYQFGPVSDMRSLLEPLGVEFIEHTLYHSCDLMCTCDQHKGFPIFNPYNIIYVNPDDIERFFNQYKNEYDIKRAHSFLVSYSMAILPLYSLLNRSVIAVASHRYERTIHSDDHRWIALNGHIRAMASQKRHVIGANSLYDREYMHFFTGIVPDYIPSFCAYTGVHYNPTRMSYLYAMPPHTPLGNFWHKRLLEHFKNMKANFEVEDMGQVYKNNEYADVAEHLGIIYVPYQTSMMMFFEQYTMGIPLFAPTLDYLVRLHMDYYVVFDKTVINRERQKGSIITPHPSMKDTYDPNNDVNVDSVRHWLSLSDFYQFPNITRFESVEKLVEILESMSMARLTVISQLMMKYNHQRLKLLLQYWRRRLVEIAALSQNRPE